MTTTEWVERYNRAFLEAGGPVEIRETGPDIMESIPCADWTEDDHKAYNIMPAPTMEDWALRVMAESLDRQVSAQFKAINEKAEAEYRTECQNALKRKETT